MKNFKQVFKIARREARFTQKQAAEFLVISRETVQNYESGKSEPSEEEMGVLIRKLKDYNSEQVAVHDPPAVYKKREGIPVYNTHAAASDLATFDDASSNLPTKSLSVPGFEDCQAGIYVYSHSMYPTYENGSMVIVKQIKNKEDIQFGSAYVIITGEQRVLKRLFPGSTEDKLLLASDNSETRKDGKAMYPSYEVKKKDILKLYIVKGTIKRTEI